MVNNHWSSPTLKAHTQMSVRMKELAGRKKDSFRDFWSAARRSHWLLCDEYQTQLPKMAAGFTQCHKTNFVTVKMTWVRSQGYGPGPWFCSALPSRCAALPRPPAGGFWTPATAARLRHHCLTDRSLEAPADQGPALILLPVKYTKRPLLL